MSQQLGFGSLSSKAALVLMVVAATPAFAAAKQARKNQERIARKACLNGDYNKGVSILSDLFVDTKDPTYIFNQGRCFEQNRRYEDAVGRFEEYIRAAEASGAGLSSEDRAAAEKHIQKCKDTLAEQGGKTSASAVPGPPAPPPLPLPLAEPPRPTPQPEPAPQMPEVSQPAPHAALTRSGSRLRTAGIVTLSVGAAAVIAGVLLNLKANSMISDMEDNVGAYSSGKDSSHQTYVISSGVSYGVGAACLLTGTILVGLGLRSKGGSTEVALVPAVGSGQAGVALTGGF
jgi:hypothetical protein